LAFFPDNAINAISFSIFSVGKHCLVTLAPQQKAYTRIASRPMPGSRLIHYIAMDKNDHFNAVYIVSQLVQAQNRAPPNVSSYFH
jgi:hypothetical protein